MCMKYAPLLVVCLFIHLLIEHMSSLRVRFIQSSVALCLRSCFGRHTTVMCALHDMHKVHWTQASQPLWSYAVGHCTFWPRYSWQMLL